MLEKRFEALLTEHGGRVLNTATRILCDAQSAQDVHQEVFLEIWRRWQKYNGRTNWKAYLYRTTVRKALEHARRSRIVPDAKQVVSRVTNHKPEDSAKTAELQRKLTRALAKLPRRQADVFVMARIEGISHQEIAEILGCSQVTVRTHLHRAMKRLARELAEFME